jgi:hypothetical protein
MDVAGTGAMLGSAVYIAHKVQLGSMDPGLLSASVAAFAIMATFLVGPRDRDASPVRHAAGPKRGLLADARVLHRDAAEAVATAAPDLRPSARAANGWRLAIFILDPCDDTWQEMRAHVARAARPATLAVIEAVATAARRQWHSGPVPLKKDGFVADILASPEVEALGTLAPRMDVVRKILDGEHPTLVRAAKLQRTLDKQPTA